MAVMSLIVGAMFLLGMLTTLWPHVQANRLAASGTARVNVAWFVGFTHRAGCDVPTYQWRDDEGAHQWVDENTAVPHWNVRGRWLYGPKSRIYVVRDVAGTRSLQWTGPGVIGLLAVCSALFLGLGFAGLAGLVA